MQRHCAVHAVIEQDVERVRVKIHDLLSLMFAFVQSVTHLRGFWQCAVLELDGCLAGQCSIHKRRTRGKEKEYWCLLEAPDFGPCEQANAGFVCIESKK